MRRLMAQVRASEIAELVGGRLSGERDVTISGVRAISDAGEGDLTFLSNRKFADLLKSTNASLILVGENEQGEDARFIRVRDPHLAIAQVLQRWFVDIPLPAGISSRAEIAKSAKLGENVRIGPFVTIGENVVIYDDVTIFDSCSIGAGSTIGKGTLIYPNVTIYHRSIIGKRCIIHSGVVIGSDGYGFVSHGGRHHKIPQIGIVRIENDVEIGAGTTIDRAALGETVIGEGTKIDNMVQVGHNAKIGKHCLLVAHVSIAGSAETGDYVVLAGQAGLAGHIRVGSHVQVAAKSAVMKSWEDRVTLAGNPARPLREHLRSEALVRKLPDLLERVKLLEKNAGIGTPETPDDEKEN